MEEPRRDQAALPAIPLRGASPCIANGCSACCHNTEMLLTEADVARLRALRPTTDFVFEARDGHMQLHTRDAPPVAGQTGRPCIFLDAAGRCSVFAARPEGCRLYPAVWDGDARKALLDAQHCPHTTDFALDGPTQRAVQALVATLLREQAARRHRRGKAHQPGTP